MADRGGQSLELKNRHTGEILAMRRVKRGGETWLELKGTLPPHRQGPPMHIHFVEDEDVYVKSGVLSYVIDGRKTTAGPGESTTIARGLAHRWWNDGDELLECEGYARPVVDFDRYLQAIFEVVNAGPDGRPPLFYIAHAALRHRHTQTVLLMPRPVQTVLFRVVVAIGTLLGRYRGHDWPGCPARCLGATAAAD